jgi:hypothetical protein
MTLNELQKLIDKMEAQGLKTMGELTTYLIAHSLTINEFMKDEEATK